MKRMVVVVAILALLMIGGVAVASQGSAGSEAKGSGTAEPSVDKAAIQAAMLGYLKKTIEVDGQTAEFDYLHSGVKEKDGLYVSCADFKAGDD